MRIFLGFYCSEQKPCLPLKFQPGILIQFIRKKCTLEFDIINNMET